MDFTSIGFIGSYTKNMKLSMNWKKRQETGDFTSKMENASSELETYMSQLDRLQQDNNPSKQLIYNKLYSGKKLSAEELAYLRENDPAAYQKAKEIEEEKIRYERELKKCRTKEDVGRLKAAYISVKTGRAKSISGSSGITGQAGLLMGENAKINAVSEVERNFKKSRAYKRLETDVERFRRIRMLREERTNGAGETEDLKKTKDLDEIRDPDRERESVKGKETKTVTFDDYMRHKEIAENVPVGEYGRMAYKEARTSSADQAEAFTIKKRKRY